MKTSLFLTTVAPFLFMASANAVQVPDPMLSVNDCMSWANSVAPSVMPAAQRRCNALADCIALKSDDRESLVECFAIAEAEFGEASGKLAYPGQGVDDHIESPVATEKADSTLYDNIPGKGWKNTTIGD